MLLDGDVEVTLPLQSEPRDLLLGSDNDLVVGKDLSFSSGVQAVAQSCRIALQMFEGEWFLNLDVGIPYWDQILTQKPAAAIAAAQLAFRDALRSVVGVLDILQLQVQYVGATRALNVTWQVSTVFGDTPVDTLSLTVGGAA